jgi:hypothetical protein
MSMQRTVILSSLGWMAAISLLHGTLNQGWFHRGASRGPAGALPFQVGFLPVT